MKEKFKTLINNKNLIIILIITLIISIGTAGTYAWFTWSNPSNTTLSMTIGNIDVIFDTGNNINITNLSPVLYPEEGAKATFSLKKNNASLGDIIYTITLDITTISNELKSTDFKWLLKKGETELTNGNFSNSSNGSTITLYTGTLTDTSTVSYDLYFYINGNNQNNSNMMNKTLTGTINISGEEEMPTLVETITNLYTNATKSTATASNITYNLASSVSLMNDRLGSSTTDINGGNIRYYGGTPNNYVYFNCSDYSNQTDTTCEKWRIIGVFNGKVKLIRNESIGNLAWDQDKNINSSLTTSDNVWDTSSLKVLLNEKYYYGDTSGVITYYSGSNGDTETSLNMSNIGIKNNTTRNIISNEVWYLGCYNDYVGTLHHDIYIGERTRNCNSSNELTWNGKVALAYQSDYTYAEDLQQFAYVPYTLVQAGNQFGYDGSTNWFHNIDVGWEITPVDYDNLRFAFAGQSGWGGSTYQEKKVFPTLYLNSNIELASNTGNGTSTNPYKLSV